MERCGVQVYGGSRRSFEKAHGDQQAPPRLQVIGFDVLRKDGGPSPASLLPMIKPATSSPRSSALQQLLLPQTPPHSPSPSSNQSLPAALPAFSSNQSLPHLASSSPPFTANSASNLHVPCGLLLPAPANQMLTSAWFLQPVGNLKSTAEVALQPAANLNQLKSLLQSVYDTSRVPADQSTCTISLSSGGQSHNPSLSSSSHCLPVSVQMISQCNLSFSKARTIEENSKALSQILQTGDDEAKEFNNGNDAEAHEITSAKEVINELPNANVAKSQKSSKSSCGNEEKSKKSSLFTFAASSPAADQFHHHHHHHGTIQCNASGNMDFLSSCHLCRRLLDQDQDVFMYSGDKAFCSMECRYQQIVMDERKDRCPPTIIRSGASPVYQHSSVISASTHHPINNIMNKPHFINTAAAA